jgi:acyl-CoA dehydrogenase family protein 9
MLDDEQKKLAEELLFSEKKKPSFAKQLFFGRFDASSVIPFPKPPSEEKQEVENLLAKLTTFVQEKIDPVAIDRNANIPKEVIRGLGELGLLSLTIPKKYYGLGLSQYAYCKCMEIVAARCAATALFINAHQSVGLKALLLFGTEAQKEKWLPKLSKGEAIAAFSLTEPNAGSDANGIETEAHFNADKNEYVINGQKQWTTNGSIAEILTVMAKTEVTTPKGVEKKVTAFLVTPDMPGFKVTAASLDKVGMRGSITSNLAFENVKVPIENILGPIGGGLKVCLTVLDYGRTTFGATCTGVAKELLKKAKEQAVSRYQFKRPLASFPLVKEKIARMNALHFAMESATYLTAGLVDQGVEDVMLESAILKVFTSDSLWQILYDTMQIFGGRSFFTDAPFERMMRDARLNMIGEGSNEVLRAFIGAVGLRDVGMELKEMRDAALSPFKNYQVLKDFSHNGLRYVFSPKIPIEAEGLQNIANELGSSVKQFGVAVLRALATYGEEIIERQLTLNRLANMAMSLYTITAVLSRLNSEIKESDHSTTAIGKFYCKMGFQQFQDNLAHLFSNNDREIEDLSDAITQVKRHD